MNTLAFNRTIVELKGNGVPDLSVPNTAFNRTIVELKEPLVSHAVRTAHF